MAEFEKVRITSILKSGVNDPQGNTIKEALHQARVAVVRGMTKDLGFK